MVRETGKKGMLWFDSTKNKPEREKILEAIKYFEKKYNTKATEVRIANTSDFSKKKDAIDGILVEHDKYVLVNTLVVY
jgi:hypothetical protein